MGIARSLHLIVAPKEQAWHSSGIKFRTLVGALCTALKVILSLLTVIVK